MCSVKTNKIIRQKYRLPTVVCVIAGKLKSFSEKLLWGLSSGKTSQQVDDVVCFVGRADAQGFLNFREY